jgi:hypothetical protein
MYDVALPGCCCQVSMLGLEALLLIRVFLGSMLLARVC